MIYLWVKAIHILAIISWMAAILYLPRLLVYHVGAPAGSDQSETFKVMERRLLRAIGTPAMIVTWITGLYLATRLDVWSMGWLHVKLAAVVAMSAMHMLIARWVRRFRADENTNSARFYRIANEVPTVLLIVIVLCVVLKPF